MEQIRLRCSGDECRQTFYVEDGKVHRAEDDSIVATLEETFEGGRTVRRFEVDEAGRRVSVSWAPKARVGTVRAVAHGLLVGIALVVVTASVSAGEFARPGQGFAGPAMTAHVFACECDCCDTDGCECRCCDSK